MTVAKRIHLPTLPSLLSGPNLPFIHRDLSWLQFNERVLANTRASTGHPLLERAKFIAISATNLDEFFMIRFASLNREVGKYTGKPRNQAMERKIEIHSTLLENIAEFGARQAEALDAVTPELEVYGVHIVRKVEEQPRYKEMAEKVFLENIFATLPPPQKFHYSYLASLENGQMGIYFPSGYWVPVPKAMPPVISVRREKDIAWFFSDDLIMAFAPGAFHLDTECSAVRMTRDCDFTVDIAEAEDPASIPTVVMSGVRARDRGAPVRLQYRGNLTEDFHAKAMKALKIRSQQLFPSAGSLLLHGLWKVVKDTPPEIGDRPELNYPAMTSRVPKPLREGKNAFELLKKRDYLLHHPYDSFEAFAEWMIAACEDEGVTCIEQTIYRTDAGSKMVDILKAAAKRKRVRVLIELRARFDELNNLSLADELKRAGVEVGFGLGDLKLHAKITLLTRKEGDKEVPYTHLSTGNYNASTARAYTDLAILTSNADIGKDARHFFDSVYQRQTPKKFSTLVTAPSALHLRLLDHIYLETEAAKAGKKGRIVAKVNALVDQTVVEALYNASQAGVKVELIVRGACSLIPGIPGLSKNIKVISVVDRFLEHSRMYYFEQQKRMYLSSADWMPRNFFSRLEIAFPVLDPRIFAFLRDTIIPLYLADNVRAMELTPQGTWKRRVKSFGTDAIRAQVRFQEMASRDYEGTALTEEI